MVAGFAHASHDGCSFRVDAWHFHGDVETRSVGGESEVEMMSGR
jgi:hypothetical protein